MFDQRGDALVPREIAQASALEHVRIEQEHVRATCRRQSVEAVEMRLAAIRVREQSERARSEQWARPG